MNYKNIFKRETKVIAYVVIALTLVVIGSSYALFMQVKNNTNNQVVKAGSLTITYSNSNTVTPKAEEDNNCLTPMEDSDGKSKGCDFKFSVKNTGTLPMAYDLLIYNNGSASNQLTDLANFKYQLTKQVYENDVTVKDGVVQNGGNQTVVTVASGDKTLNQLTDKTGNAGKKVLENAMIKAGATVVYDLKIWIKSEADESIIGKTVNLKLDVMGVVYENDTLATTISNLAKSAGDASGKVEEFNHNQVATIALTGEDDDLKEYRYTGTNPNNYVYFGCDTVNEAEEENTIKCTEDHLYRIIGLIPTQTEIDGPYVSRIKIIKDAYWKQTNTNSNKLLFNYASDWEESDVYKTLNEDYWTSLTEKYQGYVNPSVLYFGTITEPSNIPDSLYNSERNNTSGILSNVGLLYPSDYGYSLGLDRKESEINAETTSWLKKSENTQEEWLLSAKDTAFTLKTDGTIAKGYGAHAIRPTLYLQENVLVSGGEGTKENPYTLEFR